METKLQNDKINKPAIKSSNLFPVVGIGASAGGLDAFKKLLKAIPEDSGMAYVLVQHLDPNHESLLPEILQKITPIPVLEITDDVKVLPDHIYVIPSNKMMVATDGVLLLAPRPAKSKSERHLPIDLFFTSLAEVHQEHAIGVVLSGTASDGTMGLKAIKDHGGITFAQDEASAEYEGMPNSAVDAGVVDFILPPEEIPKKLLEVTNKIKLNDEDLQNFPKQDEDVFKQILSLLRIRKGVDFTYYKQTTIRRRIIRRMLVNKNEEPTDYLNFLKGNSLEQDLLYQDMLIPVTSFFRDKKVFDDLCNSVFPTIIENKIPGAITRIWVAGCSTGQEVYSFAICFKEFLGEDYERIQIFGTDLSEPAITKARTGIYEKTEIDSVSSERLKEYFRRSNGGYQVNKNIRDMCVFAHHNFLKDPPFGKMDCISCRNVLIYMEPYLQKKALTTFHYALNPKGFLLLGKSETTSGVPDLFDAVLKSDKLYTRKDVPGRFMQVASQRSEHILNSNTQSFKGDLDSYRNRTDFQKTADDILLTRYTPAGVVVNEAMDIVHFRGNTANYLEQASGKPSHNLFAMAKNGLGFELRNILHKAKSDKAVVIKENVPLSVNGNLRNISIEAVPLPNTIEPYYLILFHDNNLTNNEGFLIGNRKKVSSKIRKEEKDIQIQLLEQELAQAREDMRSITEDQEASNEELQSSNEELLSGSEELQSLNEELETSKEELQSTNEELTVLNHELISLNEQVTDARNYSESIVATLYQPLLVLDKHLRVKTANKAFYKIFNVNEQETEGVLIYDLGNRQWNIPELRTLLEEILPEKKQITDFEVTHNFLSIGERVILLSALELTREKKEEKLILLSIEDITERKATTKKIEENEKYLQNIFTNAPAAIAVLEGPELKYSLANPRYQEIANRKEEQLLGKSLKEVFSEPDNAGAFQSFYKAFKSGETFRAPEFAVLLDKNSDGVLGQFVYNLTVEPLKNANGNTHSLMAIAYDITEQVEARKNIEDSEKQKAFLLKLSDALRPLSNPVDIEESATKIAMDFMDADRCYYCTIKDGKAIIQRDAFRGELTSIAGVYPVSGNPLFRSQLLAGGPFIVNDVNNTDLLDEDLKQLCLQLQLISFLNIPFIKNGKPVGVLSLLQSKPRKWTDVEVQLTVETAERTWAALERAKALEALQQSEEKYRSLFTSIDQGFTLCELIRNKEGKGIDMYIREVNPTYEKQTGIAKEMVIDTPLLQVFPSLDKVIATYAAVVDNQQAVKFEQYFEDTSRWFAINAYPVEKEKFAVLFTNITERKQTEEKLKESESRFRTMADSSPVLIWTLDSKGLSSYYNKTFLDFLGMPKDGDISQWEPIVHPEDVQLTANTINKAIAEQSAYSLELRMLRADGDWRWVLAQGNPSIGVNNEFLGFVGSSVDITERKQVEEKIAESDKRYNMMVMQSPFAFAVLKGEDMVIYLANDSLKEMWGKGKEIEGKPLLEVLPEIKDQPFPALLNKVYSTGIPYHDNESFAQLERNGRLEDVYFNSVYQPYREADETISGITIISIEVTPQAILNKKIKTSEERFQAAVAAVEGIVWTNNAKGEMEGEQLGWASLTGQTYEEYQGYGWINAIHPDDAKTTIDAWNEAVKEKRHFIFEHRVKIKNGNFEYFSVKAIPLLDADRLLWEWVGVHTNISERYKAEKAEKESENKFRQMAELMPQKVWTADAEGNKTYFNKTLVDYSGYSFEEIQGSGWQKIVHPDDWEINKIQWEQSLRTGEDYEVDNRLLRKDGKYLWHLNRAVAVKDEDGNIKMWIGSKTEIEEHRKHSQDLEVAKNDADLKRKMAEDAMKAKQQFLSNMSHEIRTPMNAIVGFTNVLTKTGLNKNQKEYINAIKTSADALIFLINDILDLAKVDSGKMTFEQAPFELNIIMFNIIQLFEPKAQEKNLKLEILYDPAIPKVLIGDQMRLRQVLLNLVSNSMKFTSEGKIVLEAKLLEEDQESAIIEISITDTGIGIAANRLERIFEDFEQAAYENSRLYGGTGLGLSIVKKLILLQGGTINVASVLGEGSTFSVKQKFGKIKIIKPIEELAKIQNSIPLKIENIKILVAEDVALNQLLIKIILLDFGFEIFIAENGKIAIEQLQKDKYDIILMDLQMPIMNGYEATDFIRNNMKSTIPIIALTADVTTVDVDKCIAMGMNDYISKPIDEVLLFDKILKLLPNF